MRQTRRQFIAASLASAVTVSSANIISAMEKKKEKQICHHVFFWLKRPGSEEDRNRLLEGVRSLRKIETIREFHVGVPAETEKRPVIDSSYSVSELLFFDDLEGQKTYQDHPLHRKFAEKYSDLWEKVVVYDTREI